MVPWFLLRRQLLWLRLIAAQRLFDRARGLGRLARARENTLIT
jgi:hypothetical protein